MARSKIKSTKADVDFAIQKGVTVEVAAQRRVLIEALIRLMPKGEYPSYSLNLLKSLHLQHIGPLPEGFEEDEEIKKEIPEVIVE